MDSALISAFQRDGWVLVPDALDKKLIDEAREALGNFYPSYDELDRRPKVAEWAGQSVEILYRVYAHCLDDEEDRWYERMEHGLG